MSKVGPRLNLWGIALNISSRFAPRPRDAVRRGWNALERPSGAGSSPGLRRIRCPRSAPPAPLHNRKHIPMQLSSLTSGGAAGQFRHLRAAYAHPAPATFQRSFIDRHAPILQRTPLRPRAQTTTAPSSGDDFSTPPTGRSTIMERRTSIGDIGQGSLPRAAQPCLSRVPAADGYAMVDDGHNSRARLQGSCLTTRTAHRPGRIPCGAVAVLSRYGPGEECSVGEHPANPVGQPAASTPAATWAMRA